MIAPKNADEEAADARITSRGIPFLDANYPNWQSLVFHAAKRLADPTCCPMVALEKNRQTGSPYTRVQMGAPVNNPSAKPHEMTFFDVLRLHNMTIDDAIACGFAKHPDDPCTFYATLRDRWQAHTRHAVQGFLHLDAVDAA